MCTHLSDVEATTTLYTRSQAECVTVLEQALEVQSNEEDILQSFVRCLSETLAAVARTRVSSSPKTGTRHGGWSSSSSSPGSDDNNGEGRRGDSSVAEKWLTGIRDAEHLVIHTKILETKHDSLLPRLQHLAEAFARSLIGRDTERPGKAAASTRFFAALADSVRQLAEELVDFTKLQWEAVESLGEQLKATAATSIPSPNGVALFPGCESSVAGVVRFAQQLLDVVATKRKLIVTFASVLRKIQVPPPVKVYQHPASETKAPAGVFQRSESAFQELDAAAESAARELLDVNQQPISSVVTRREAMQWLKTQLRSSQQQHPQQLRREGYSDSQAAGATDHGYNHGDRDRAFRREVFGVGGAVVTGFHSPSGMTSASGSRIIQGKSVAFVEVESNCVAALDSSSPDPPHPGRSEGASISWRRCDTAGANDSRGRRKHTAEDVSALDSPQSNERPSALGGDSDDIGRREEPRRGYSGHGNRTTSPSQASPVAAAAAAVSPLSPSCEALSDPSPHDGRTSGRGYRFTIAKSRSATGGAGLSTSISPVSAPSPPPLARNLMHTEYGAQSDYCDIDDHSHNNRDVDRKKVSVGRERSAADHPTAVSYPQTYQTRNCNPQSKHTTSHSPVGASLTSPPSPSPSDWSTPDRRSGEEGDDHDQAEEERFPSISPPSPPSSPRPQRGTEVAPPRAQQMRTLPQRVRNMQPLQEHPNALSKLDNKAAAPAAVAADSLEERMRQPLSARSSTDSFTSTAGETQSPGKSTAPSSSVVSSLQKSRRNVTDGMSECAARVRAVANWYPTGDTQCSTPTLKGEPGSSSPLQTQCLEEQESTQKQSRLSPLRLQQDQRLANEQFHSRLLAAERAIEHHQTVVETLRADIRRLEAERSALMLEQQEWCTLEKELTTTVRKKDTLIRQLRLTLAKSEGRCSELELETRQLKKQLLLAAGTTMVSPSATTPLSHSAAAGASLPHRASLGHPYLSPQLGRDQESPSRSQLQQQRERLLRQLEQRRTAQGGGGGGGAGDLRGPKAAAGAWRSPVDHVETLRPSPAESSAPIATSLRPDIERVLQNARSLLRSINSDTATPIGLRGTSVRHVGAVSANADDRGTRSCEAGADEKQVIPNDGEGQYTSQSGGNGAEPVDAALSPCASLSYSASKQAGGHPQSHRRHGLNEDRDASSAAATRPSHEPRKVKGVEGEAVEGKRSRSTSSARDDLLDELRDHLNELYCEQANVTEREAHVHRKRETAVHQLQRQLKALIANGKGSETAQLVSQANAVMAKFDGVRRTVEASRKAVEAKITEVKKQIETLESDLL